MKTKLMKFKLYKCRPCPDDIGTLHYTDENPQGEIAVRARLHIFNEGTVHQFSQYHITDRQLNFAIGARGLSWSGDLRHALYATDKKGNPACELRRIKEN